MTQQEVADELGISLKLLQIIEAVALQKMADGLGIERRCTATVARAMARKTRACRRCGQQGHYASTCHDPNAVIWYVPPAGASEAR